MANTVCDFLGCNDVNNGVAGLHPNSGLTLTVSNLIKFGLGLVFVLIVVFGIFLTIKAALTIINSNGNTGKVEEGTNAIKGVFLGIAVIIVGIVGVFLIFAFFQGTSLLNQNVNVPNGVNIPIINQ